MTQQPQPPRTPPASAASRPGQPSIGELINRISENITGLVKGEIELARAKALRMANAAGIGAAFLTVAAVAALFGLGFLLSAIVDLLAMVMPVWAAKLIVVVILFAVAVATALPGRDKLREAKAELKKVTWPGRKQIWFSTLVVIFFTLCASIYLGAIDFLLTWVLSGILS